MPKKIGFTIYPSIPSEQMTDIWEALPESERALCNDLFMFEFGETALYERNRQEHSSSSHPLKLFSNPNDFEYGGNQKIILRYAIDSGLDYLIICRPEAASAENLSMLINAVLKYNSNATLSKTRSLSGSITNTLFNILLSTSFNALNNFARILTIESLKTVPFELNSDYDTFDHELMIQMRAINAKTLNLSTDVQLKTPLPITSTLSAFACALLYRLHQLHIKRSPNYIIEHDVKYTFKHSPYGSHVQIVGMVDPGTNVLDMGCSQGMIAAPLKQKNVSITGVDIIPKEFVSKMLDTYICHNIYKLSELELKRSFDYIIFADVIEHITTPVDILRECRKFLKPSGSLIISTPNIAIWFYRISLMIGRFEYGPRGILDNTHVHLYTLSSLKSLINKAGFGIKKIGFTGLPFEIIFESTGKSVFVKGLSWLYYRLVKFWPKLFAYQIIIEADLTALDNAMGEGIVNASLDR